MEDSNQGASGNDKLGILKDESLPLGFNSPLGCNEIPKGFCSEEESRLRVQNSPLNPFLGLRPNPLLELESESELKNKPTFLDEHVFEIELNATPTTAV